jgi:hypothetical protein
MSKRSLPFERRARKPGAGLVKPGETRPKSALSWKRWTLEEARKHGQGELFGSNYCSVDPEAEAVRRQKRRKRRMGVFA